LKLHEGCGHVTCGGLICVAVSVSIESKSTSALRPTVTVPWMGSTQAKLEGDPLYSIWSYSVVCVPDTASSMRSSVMSVSVCVGG
jgi:hypothetical protein